MNGLTIEARSLESARGIEAALEGFDRELVVDDDGRYSVHVSLPSGDQGIVAVLNALEEYVSHRGDGPARVNMNGQSYLLEGVPRDD